jgi:hypothetical protein
LSAWLVTGENLDEVAAWCGGRVEGRDIGRPEVAILREDGDTWDWAEPGQYVVCGVTGRFFPVEAWMFERDLRGGRLMARYVTGSLPSVVLPVDRVTLHEWVWPEDETVDEAWSRMLRTEEFGPLLDEVHVEAGFEGMVSFPPHQGDPIDVCLVTWHEGRAMYGSGPVVNVRPGDSPGFGPLPLTGTVVGAS